MLSVENHENISFTEEIELEIESSCDFPHNIIGQR